MKYRPFWLAGFFISQIGLRNTIYGLLKLSLKLSDFHLRKLLINFNGSLLKMRLKSNKWNFIEELYKICSFKELVRS
jgi:hypothetical protein